MEPQMTAETLLIAMMQAFPHRGANCNTLDPFITQMKDRFVPEYHSLITHGLLTLPGIVQQAPQPAVLDERLDSVVTEEE